MIWAPDLDDFSGNFCNRGRYPLMNTVVNLIRTGIIVPIEIPTIPTTTTTAATTTSTLPITTPSIVSPSVSGKSISV
jgi:chitinase